MGGLPLTEVKLMSTDSDREGGYPPNNAKPVAKRRPFNARLFAEDLITVLVVAGREAPENRWATLEVGVRQVTRNHPHLFNSHSLFAPKVNRG